MDEQHQRLSFHVRVLLALNALTIFLLLLLFTRDADNCDIERMLPSIENMLKNTRSELWLIYFVVVFVIVLLSSNGIWWSCICFYLMEYDEAVSVSIKLYIVCTVCKLLFFYMSNLSCIYSMCICSIHKENKSNSNKFYNIILYNLSFTQFSLFIL